MALYKECSHTYFSLVQGNEKRQGEKKALRYAERWMKAKGREFRKFQETG